MGIAGWREKELYLYYTPKNLVSTKRSQKNKHIIIVSQLYSTRTTPARNLARSFSLFYEF